MAFHVTHKHFTPCFCSLNDALYFTLEAKFMAESADTVGESTFVTVWEVGEKIRFIDEHDVDKIRNEWRRSGAPRQLKKVLTMLSRMLYDFGQE